MATGMRAQQGLFGIRISNLVTGCRPRGMWISLVTAYLVVLIKTSVGLESCPTTCPPNSQQGECPAGCYEEDQACKECPDEYYSSKGGRAKSCEICTICLPAEEIYNNCSRCENRICGNPRSTTPTTTPTTTPKLSTEIPKVPTNTTPCQCDSTVNSSGEPCENTTCPEVVTQKEESNCPFWTTTVIGLVIGLAAACVCLVVCLVVGLLVCYRRKCTLLKNANSRKEPEQTPMCDGKGDAGGQGADDQAGNETTM